MNKSNTNTLKIYHGDAYELVSKLKSENLTVNHIITDPPYNISKKNNFNTMNSANRQGVDFGEWDKQFDLYSWISVYGELISNGGSFIIFSSYRYLSYIADELERSGFIVKDILKWIKSNPMPRNVTRRYVQDTEYAIWAVKPGEKWIFNKPEENGYLRAEFKTPTVAGRERTKHPTQKSYKLMSDIIQIHSNSGDTIMDPFMGSGTTGVAALRHNRNFIGIELSNEYYDIAKNRLHEITCSDISK